MESEDVLKRLKQDEATQCTGLDTCRIYTALGEIYQRRNHPARALIFYDAALESRPDWVPAHVGLIETEIIRGNAVAAQAYLEEVIAKTGPDPHLLLMLASVALMLSKPEKAHEIACQIEGELLGDDRFEHFLFQLDFFNHDREALTRVPYHIKGATIETEAARVWLLHLNGQTYQSDSARIPADTWREEYLALEEAWRVLTA